MNGNTREIILPASGRVARIEHIYQADGSQLIGVAVGGEEITLPFEPLDALKLGSAIMAAATVAGIRSRINAGGAGAARSEAEPTIDAFGLHTYIRGGPGDTGALHAPGCAGCGAVVHWQGADWAVDTGAEGRMMNNNNNEGGTNAEGDA